MVTRASTRSPTPISASCGDCRRMRDRQQHFRRARPRPSQTRRLGDQIPVVVTPDHVEHAHRRQAALRQQLPRLPDNAPSSVSSAMSLFKASRAPPLMLKARAISRLPTFCELSRMKSGRLLSTASGRHRRRAAVSRAPAFFPLLGDLRATLCSVPCHPADCSRDLIDQARPALVQRGVPAKDAGVTRRSGQSASASAFAFEPWPFSPPASSERRPRPWRPAFFGRRLLRGRFLAFLPPPLAARSAISATASSMRHRRRAPCPWARWR